MRILPPPGGEPLFELAGRGHYAAGGFAQYVAAPAKACYPVPESLSDTQMAFIEPLACIVHGMSRLRIPPADSVLLFGAGPIGLLLLQAMRHSGAGPIVVVESSRSGSNWRPNWAPRPRWPPDPTWPRR
ncbi:MAG: hypothetical protein R2911_16215 [Caldilineaceae bacterium]